MRLISPSIDGIWIVLQKELKYFNGNVVLTAFLASFPVELVIFCLYLNGALLPGKLSRTSASVKSGSSL